MFFTFARCSSYFAEQLTTNNEERKHRKIATLAFENACWATWLGNPGSASRRFSLTC
jgi:hypothetical protein